MAIVFNNWDIKIVGTIARQYDNLSRRIDVEGDLPDGYEWKLLLKHESGDADTILLEPTETGVGVVLTADNLAKDGYYSLQLRGVLKADGVTVRHTNVVTTFIPSSLTGIGTWPELPTEFTQIEQRCTASMIAAESAAEAAKADADAAAQSAADAANAKTGADTAKDAAVTAQGKAEDAQKGAEDAKTKAEASKEASAKSEAAAKLSEQNAKASEDATKSSETNAAGSASAAAKSATAAQTAQSGAEAAKTAAAQSAQEAAESAAVYDNVVSDVNQLKQDVAAITPDDTTVDGKPWTSKKIVDSLCMPFEESGNPVQCYPVENYPLGVKVQIEPTQEGSGDPSPDNIRPISGRDAVSVTRCGKNLLRMPLDFMPSSTVNGLDYNYNEDKSSTLVGTASSNTNFIIRTFDAGKRTKIEAGTYTLQTGIEGSRTNFLIYNDNTSDDRYLSKSQEGKFTYTFTLPDEKYFGLYFSVLKGSTVNGTMYPQIELGATPTAYEPYTGDTYDIALPETVYGGTLDVETGDGNENIKIITLDGTEKVDVNNQSSKTSVFRLNFDVPAKPFNGTSEALWIVSSHFIKGTNLYFSNAEPNTIWYNDAGTQIRIAWNPGNNPSATIDEFKAFPATQYAAGTPVQICYKLAEPVPFNATGAQPIPALSGVNTIYTDADGVIVTGAEDPKHTITELKNAIISLGGNV